MMVRTMMLLLVGMHKKFCKKKIGLTILLIVSLCTVSLAQRRIDSPTIIARGRCADILKEIKDSTKSDSIATQLFIRYYTFDNGVSFTASQWKRALRFITDKENSQLFCTSKAFRREQVLIGDPAKEAKEIRADSLKNK